jgi:hypothetical protein
LQEATGPQVPRQVEPEPVIGARKGSECPADLDGLLDHRQGLLIGADVLRERGQLIVGATQRRARIPVLAVPEEPFELAVEVGRSAEQPGAELLELLLLEQEVLADLAVEEPDRVHGQVESRALAKIGGPELLVGPAHVVVGLLQLDEGPLHLGIRRLERRIGALQCAVGVGLDG